MSNAEDADTIEPQDILRLSADVVASYLSSNTVSASAIPELLRSVHDSFSQLDRPAPPAAPAERPKAAVPISRSITDDYIVCLEDGKRLKMLKRYLRSKFGMSPDDYRRRWGLPPDYPMVAPAYATRRSEFAKQIGLGKGVRRPSGTKAPAAKPRRNA
ncbi:MAG TPA: MucR family transcriptional regulator [Caulobacteraceae bacterium]|jgi:predicted transcriptional regulator|nr:MucR family transcriptional regulator [Caulobacteraceae bacterium]